MPSSNSEPARYRITVTGCDDSTTVEHLYSASDAELVIALAEMITEASEYGCQPIMRVELVA